MGQLATILTSAVLAAGVLGFFALLNGWRDRVNRREEASANREHEALLRQLDREHEAQVRQLDREHADQLRQADREHEARLRQLDHDLQERDHYRDLQEREQEKREQENRKLQGLP